MVEEERQRGFVRGQGQEVASGSNSRPLGEVEDNRRNQVPLHRRIELPNNLSQEFASSNNPRRESQNQSHHAVAAALEPKYTCGVLRDTRNFEQAFAMIDQTSPSYSMQTPFNYSIERARLITRTSKKWLGDSGASSHCSANQDLFIHLEQIEDTPI